MTPVAKVKPRIEDLLSSGNVVVFTGAGVSYDPPSSLPLGVELIECLLGQIAPQSLKPFVMRCRNVRPESVMQVLHENIGDVLFEALSPFANAPNNHLHNFIARLFKEGHVERIITTNLDLCHEKAGDDDEKIHHLHGAASATNSVIYALNQVAKHQLSPELKQLTELLKGKTVVFLGYSGADDFDIAPVLASLGEKCTYVWFDHQPKFGSWREAGPDLTERSFGEIFLNLHPDDYYVYEGDTWAFCKDWATWLGFAAEPPAVMEPRKQGMARFNGYLEHIFKDIGEIEGTLVVAEILWRYANDANTALHILRSVNSSHMDGEKRKALFRVLAYSHYRSGHFAKAKRYCDKALNEAFDDSKVSRPLLFKLRGNIAYQEQQFTEAESFYQQAMDYARSIGSPRHEVALILTDLALLLQDLGRTEEALDYYEKSEALLSEAGDLYALSDLFNNRAIIYETMNELSAALDEHQRALQLREQIGHNQGLVYTKLNIGILHRVGKLTQGWPYSQEQAKKYMEEALQLGARSSSDVDVALVSKNLGDLFIDMGEFNLAEARLLSALNLYTKSRYVTGINSANISLLELYLIEKKHHKIKQMLNKLERAFTEIPASKIEWYKMLALIARGEESVALDESAFPLQHFRLTQILAALDG